MNNIQQIPIEYLLYPQLTNGTPTSQTIDVTTLGQGAARARVAVLIGATDVDFTSLYLIESDDNFSTSNTVTGSRYGTDSGTLPQDGEDNIIVGWCLDLQGLKRYIKIVAVVAGTTGTTGANVCAIFEKDKTENTFSPDTYAQGFDQLIYV